MAEECFVIVGAGHAAALLAPGLRQQGWQGRIIVVGDEAYLPYHRPPLSKHFLAGEKSVEEILIRPATVYEKTGVEFILETRATSLDRRKKTVQLNNGQALRYDKLALVTGSRVRRLDLPGADLPGVFYLRRADDVERIRPYIKRGAHAVIIGGGYIGLETAAVLNGKGMCVTALEQAERILPRVTSPVVSAFYNRVHQEAGVSIHCGASVSSLTGKDRVEQAQCGNGAVLPAELVIIGVGILPDVDLAQAAGLRVDNGIVTDAQGRTSDPDIFAAGDCACHYNPIYNRVIRLESVQNASEQAREIAAAACGKPANYAPTPWFWSEQYDLMLQIAGLSQGYDDTALRGDATRGREFTLFYLRGGKMIGADAVNRPREFMAAKQLIASGQQVNAAQLADPDTPIKDLL